MALDCGKGLVAYDVLNLARILRGDLRVNAERDEVLRERRVPLVYLLRDLTPASVRLKCPAPSTFRYPPLLRSPTARLTLGFE